MNADTSEVTSETSRPIVGTRSVDIVVSLLLLGVALLLGWDSWRIGMSWADDGPQAGYFPFYLSVMMGAASVYGLVRAVMARAGQVESRRINLQGLAGCHTRNVPPLKRGFQPSGLHGRSQEFGWRAGMQRFGGMKPAPSAAYSLVTVK